MKRAKPWNSQGDDSSSSEESSFSDTDTESGNGSGTRREKSITKIVGQQSQGKTSGAKSAKKSGAVCFEALRRHGYKGGQSVLGIPAPKVDEKQDWSWSTGKERIDATKDTEESYEERKKTRAALVDGEELANVQTRKEKNLSFSQKEKRKRDLGQASRGKNYVEEEKRLLRESGIYSGFDS